MRIKRQKNAKRVMLLYRVNFSLIAPYNVLGILFCCTVFSRSTITLSLSNICFDNSLAHQLTYGAVKPVAPDFLSVAVKQKMNLREVLLDVLGGKTFASECFLFFAKL